MRMTAFTKALLVGFLVLLLLVPLGMVRSVIDERQARHREAIAEVSQIWGGPQQLVGPVLSVPFRVAYRDDKDRVHYRTERAELLPERLDVQGTAVPEVRKRGLFEVVVYKLDLTLSGRMPAFDISSLGVAAEDVFWNEATLSFGIPDTRGVKEELKLTWDGADVAFRPGPGDAGLFASGIHAALPAAKDSKATHTFAFHVTVQGSQSIQIAPVAIETRVALKSSWPNPSFNGAFLPEKRTIDANGFAAEWRVSYFGRSVPQLFRADANDPKAVAASLDAANFGVVFYQPADHYQQATRAVKYGVLFVALTFLAFFLFEVMASLKLHPIPYLLVGLALALFYLLVVSLSERIGFGPAYLVAATATVTLVSLYASRLLERKTRALVVALGLTGLYGYLYVLLRREDDALLLGSVALFAVLAAIMYATRNVDWSRATAATAASMVGEES